VTFLAGLELAFAHLVVGRLCLDECRAGYDRLPGLDWAIRRDANATVESWCCGAWLWWFPMRLVLMDPVGT
jgi:hypothetical protein